MNAIEVQGISKAYGQFRLADIDITLPSGTIMGLVGENGAGKSTLINIIMNTVDPDSGSVSVLGVPNSSKDFIDAKQDIGVVLDEATFPEMFSAKSISTIMSKTYKNWDTNKYFSYIDSFKIDRNKKFKDYSRGMKMKSAIAVALAHDAKLLILDEATSGLDPLVREEILEILNEFTRDENNSILMSSHIVSDLEKICDYIAFLHQGELVICDEKDEVLDKYGICKISPEQLSDIPEHIVISKKQTEYGLELLVLKRELSSAFPTEVTTLEDIILFLSRRES